MSKPKKYTSAASLCAHELPVRQTPTPPHTNPIYATTAFTFDSAELGMHTFQHQQEGFIYSRWDNPGIEAVENKIAALEGFGLTEESGQPLQLKARLFASGMGTISCILQALLKSGDKILSQGDLYGGTNELMAKGLSRHGMEPVFIDLQDLEEAERQLQDKSVEVLYVETPANPTMKVYDLQKLAELAHRYDAKVVVDNTFSTPLLQQPFKYGADFVLHSSTKYLNGHANGISGAVVGRDIEFMNGPFRQACKLLGANSNAFDAFLLSNGLKTLALRMRQHSDNGRKVAEFLLNHNKVDKVNYIGLDNHPDKEIINKQMTGTGGMLSFELQGSFEAGVRFMNALRFCTIAATLGTIDTILQHPASMTHVGVAKELRESYGISDGLVRMSIGIEDAADIIADIEQALEQV